MEFLAATIGRIVRTFLPHVSGSVNKLSSLKEFPVTLVEFPPLTEYWYPVMQSWTLGNANLGSHFTTPF